MAKLLLLLLLLPLLAAVAGAVECPPACRCTWVVDSLYANCSRRGLSVYPSFDSVPVEHLDLSGNNFRQFPAQYADMDALLYLDLSDNRIADLAPDALIGFTSLRTLLLANNSIADWTRLNADEAFKYAPSLKQLSLRGNRLGSFGGDAAAQLNSQSLTELDLSAAHISVVGGDLLLTQLPNLQRLSLAGNQLSQLQQLPSSSLRELDLSNCSLQRLSSLFLQALPNLELLSVAHNTQLQLSGAEDELLVAYELRRLDASYCNLDQIDLSGLPVLVELRLRGNMLRSVDQRSFANNTLLEQVDLSRNLLRLIGNEAFSALKRLRQLNLAYNEIAHLDRNLVRGNDVLLELNLSRNIIQRLTKLVSNSLRLLNVSWCEISSVEGTALSGLSAVQHLDLSHNLISDLPSLMRSETLQQLNLANCRLSTIRNSSFRGFPELADLHLNGNRLTNPIPPAYFRANKFLDQIWLGDNPWICECQNAQFVEFYDYLTAKPTKLKDRHHLRCASPAQSYGQLWEHACLSDWTLSARSSSNGEKIWSTVMLSILGIGLLMLVYGCGQKMLRNHRKRQNRREFNENHDELRRIRDINERMLREESSVMLQPAQEVSLLPSYEDALLMPKLERPVKSMLDLSATERSRKQLRRSQTRPEADAEEEEEGLQLDTRQRFRSVEMLSNRDKERRAQYGPHRRTGHMEYSTQSGSRRFSIEESRFPAGNVKRQNLQSAEQIGNFQSYENSPYTKRRPKIAEIPPFKRANLRADSVEFLTDPEYEDLASKPGSPFAKRKPKLQVSAQVYTLLPVLHQTQLAPAVEDYFSSAQKMAATSASSSTIASDFQELGTADIASLPDDDRSIGSTSGTELDLERGKRKKRRNSASRRVSGNFSAATAAAGDNSSSGGSDGERSIHVHKPMRETLF